jgi:hypothetical protein
MNRAKQVSRDYAGKPLYLTLSTLIENALIAEMDRIESGEVPASDPRPRINHSVAVRTASPTRRT